MSKSQDHGGKPAPPQRAVPARRPWTLLLVTCALLSITACSLLGNDATAATLGHETRIEPEGVLTCSQACRERGQCGTADQGSVVLGSVIEPVTAAHDALFPADTRVFVNAIAPYTLRQIADGSVFSINFYNVTVPGGITGWVAGWCVAAP